MNEHVMSMRRHLLPRQRHPCAIAQVNPLSSRAIAVAALGLAFPWATSRRKRVVGVGLSRRCYTRLSARLPGDTRVAAQCAESLDTARPLPRAGGARADSPPW